VSAPLCPPCTAARTAWLDAKPVLREHRFQIEVAHLNANRRYGNGVGGHSGPRTWWALVRFHRDLIARTCRAAGHVVEPPAARVVQLDLFAALGERGGA